MVFATRELLKASGAGLIADKTFVIQARRSRPPLTEQCSGWSTRLGRDCVHVQKNAILPCESYISHGPFCRWESACCHGTLHG